MTNHISRELAEKIAKEAGAQELHRGSIVIAIAKDDFHKALNLAIDKVIGEPAVYAAGDYEEIMKIRNGCTLVSRNQTDLHMVPLYALKEVK